MSDSDGITVITAAGNVYRVPDAVPANSETHGTPGELLRVNAYGTASGTASGKPPWLASFSAVEAVFWGDKVHVMVASEPEENAPAKASWA